MNIEFKHEQYGAISCTGEIIAFKHNDKESYLSFKIKEKEIKGKEKIRSSGGKSYPCNKFFGVLE